MELDKSGQPPKGEKKMKKYLIIYETSYGDLFKKVYDYPSQKEALRDFKEKNTKYGYRVIVIREVTSNDMYL